MATAINDSENRPLLDDDEYISYSDSRKVQQQTLETDDKLRWKSIRICYITFFVSSLGFSICMSSVWPYLQQIDKDADEAFLGWVIAAFSIGQLVASPILGLLFNLLKQAKLPLLVAQVLGLIGSLLYSYVHVVPSHRRYAVLAARFVIGAGAGNGAVIRSFVAGATTVEERTSVMATVSMSQSLGFIIGPAVQAAFTGLGYPGPLHSPLLAIDMYTSAGLLSVLLGSINMIIIIMWFKEFFFDRSVGDASASLNSSSAFDSEEHQPKPDALAGVVCIMAFCALFYNFSTLETVMTPLSEVMFAWTKEKASLYNGIALAACGFISLIAFISIKGLAKIMSENDMIVLGLSLTFLAFALLMPWSGPPPPLQSKLLTNATKAAHQLQQQHQLLQHSTSPSSGAGCPENLRWCSSEPAVSFPLAVMAIIVHSVGYPVAMVMVSTVITKVLGPMRQGVWMGWMTGFASLSRCIGPVASSQLFANFGPQTLFLTSCGIVLACLIVVTRFAHRLVPYDVYRMRRQRYSTYPAI